MMINIIFSISQFLNNSLDANNLNNAQPAMQTSVSPLSTNNALQPTSQHLFTNIVNGADRYRILTQQCKSTINALDNLRIFWLIICLVQVGAIANQSQIFPQSLPIFGTAFVGVVTATGIAIKKRTQFVSIFLFSLINLTIFLATSTILSALSLNYIVIPNLVYIFLQTIGSIFLLSDRNKLMPKFLLLLQLFMICLKLDNRIKTQWLQVYFGFLLTFFIAGIVMLSMMVFWVVNIIFFKENPFSIKHVGLIFVSLNSLSATLLSMLPISYSFFGFNLIYVAIIGVLINFGTIMYSGIFKLQIVLFMCRVQKIKTYNQMISLVKIPNKLISQYIFFKKSENWFQRMSISQLQQLKRQKQKQVQKLKNKKPIQSSKENRKMSDSTSHSDQKSSECQTGHNEKQEDKKCLICFELLACIVWMPCGHLTVCEICCDKMLQNKCANCLLCKDLPEAIYHIIQDQKNIEHASNQHIAGTGMIQAEGQVKSKDKLKQMSTKDLDSLQSSLSGNISDKQINQLIKSGEKNIFSSHFFHGQILKIRNAYSVKVH